MEHSSTFKDTSFSLSDTMRTELQDSEEKVLADLLNTLQITPVAQKLLDITRASHDLSLVDPANVMAEGRSVEEIQPFTRALGVTRDDLWRHFYPQPAALQQDIDLAQADLIPQLEAAIAAAHKSAAELLETKNPREGALRLQSAIEAHKTDKQRLAEKRQKLMDAIAKVSKACAELLDSVLQVISSNQEVRQDNCPGEEVALKNIRLKLELTYREIWQGVYNEQTLTALQEIYKDLVLTLDEQLDIKAQMKSKLQKYATNPRLMEIFAEYSKVQRQIEAKRRDIAALQS